MNQSTHQNKIIPLSLLLSQTSSTRLVCYRSERAIYWDEFVTDISSVSSQILLSEKTSTSSSRWLLICEDSYWFAVGFFALLYCNQKIVLPANGLTQTISEIEGDIKGILTDHSAKEYSPIKTEYSSPMINIDLSSLKNKSNFNEELRLTDREIDETLDNIEIFTSGSTGKPERVYKSLENLTAEIECLETLWGKNLDNNVILSTVSHQHIYGLLFRLLWPISAGRAFVSRQFEYPEALLAEANNLARHGTKSLLISSPAQLKRMTQLINVEELTPLTSHIFSSGGPLLPETAGEFERQFGQAPIEVFGSTETGGVGYRQQIEYSSQPWQSFTSVTIRCNDNQQLLIQSPFINQPSGDWFVMGDKVELLNQQQFILNGRTDRIVKIEEKRLSLTEMESYLLTHDWIDSVKLLVLSGTREQVACVTILTQKGRDFLALNGKKLINLKLREHLNTKYEKVVLPRKWRYVDEFPFNTQGKVTQNNLVALFLEPKIVEESLL